jgi:hypothetical protein
MIKCAVLLRYNHGNGSKEGYHLEDGVGKKKHGQSFFESKGSSKNYDHQNCSTVRPSVETRRVKKGGGEASAQKTLILNPTPNAGI